MEGKKVIKRNLEDALKLKQLLLENDELIQNSESVARFVVECFQQDGKVLFCGNGGSAADAQHLAAELSGRYYYDRPALFAEALHVNSSYITAVANDNSYDEIYSRLISSLGKEGDVLIGMSTSGNSENIVRALKAGNKKGMKTVAFTGHDGGKLKHLADITIQIPSQDTPRIQECHLLLGHAICEIVEKEMFPKS